MECKTAPRGYYGPFRGTDSTVTRLLLLWNLETENPNSSKAKLYPPNSSSPHLSMQGVSWLETAQEAAQDPPVVSEAGGEDWQDLLGRKQFLLIPATHTLWEPTKYQEC